MSFLLGLVSMKFNNNAVRKHGYRYTPSHTFGHAALIRIVKDQWTPDRLFPAQMHSSARNAILQRGDSPEIANLAASSV